MKNTTCIIRSQNGLSWPTINRQGQAPCFFNSTLAVRTVRCQSEQRPLFDERFDFPGPESPDRLRPLPSVFFLGTRTPRSPDTANPTALNARGRTRAAQPTRRFSFGECHGYFLRCRARERATEADRQQPVRGCGLISQCKTKR